MRAAIRTLVALTLMAWGQFSFAVDYYWNQTQGGGSGGSGPSSPSALCQSLKDSYLVSWPEYVEVVDDGSGYMSAERYQCKYKGKRANGTLGVQRSVALWRHGDSCREGTNYNPATFECDGPVSAPCSESIGKEIVKTQVCQYNKTTKLADCEDQIAFEGCKYTGGGGKSCILNIELQIYECTGSFYGSGESSGTAPDSCTGEDCSEVVEGDPESNCVTSNGVKTCITDKETGCGTVEYGGKTFTGCFQENPGCGVYQGTYQCIDADKPNRNCVYFNGKQTCFDPNDPTKVIADTSSDHPANGGNADGDDTNDPRPSGGTGTSVQGGGSGATNEAISDLGEKLGPKIDKTNSLLTDIRGKFEELNEGLLGGEFSEGDLGDEAGAGQAGENAAGALGEALEGKAEEIQEGRDAEAEAFLDALPGTVGDWFGVSGEKVGLDGVLDGVLPTALGCADYRIEFTINNPINSKPYTVRLDLPVCELTRLKPLLEWVIWIVTVVGLWKILYSALRQEDVKASKGGF
ncbi:hypothetical protein FQZ97_544910 [compost metagenome]